MRRKGLILTLLLFLLGGCQKMDQAVVLFRMNRAFSSLNSMTAETTLVAEGEMITPLLSMPVNIEGSGQLQGQRDRPQFGMKMDWTGGSGILQIPLATEFQARRQDEGWQQYDFLRRQWKPLATSEIPEWDSKMLFGLLKEGQWDLNQTVNGVRCALITLTPDPQTVTSLFEQAGVQPPWLTLVRQQDFIQICLMVDFKSGNPVSLKLESTSSKTEEQDRLMPWLKQLRIEMKLTQINATSWIQPE